MVPWPRHRCSSLLLAEENELSEKTAALQSNVTSAFLPSEASTPALVFDDARLRELAGLATEIRNLYGVDILYAVKACAFFDVLEALEPSVDGFAVSSLFEARLLHDLYPNVPLHLTAPGLRFSEIQELSQICSFVAFNSETQLDRFGPLVEDQVSVGIRVNTHVSHVDDPRYDPARLHSKLGVPLQSLYQVLSSSPVEVRGLHFHTNADSEDLTELEENVDALVSSRSDSRRFDWVNFGGGYLFGDISDFEPFERSVALAKRDLANSVMVEPGAAMVRDACKLVGSVIDVFRRNGLSVAILDTSVNHLPEVLEFGYRPEVKESTAGGSYEYLIAGSSCLAGDVFGKYRFDTPLAIGTTLTFVDSGAYAHSKAHRFNGLNLPDIWTIFQDGFATKRQTPGYVAYMQHWMPDD